MKKKRILLGIIVTVFFLFSGATALLLKKKQDFRQTVINIPRFCLPQTIDSILFCNSQLIKDTPVVLIYVHPECDICRIEMQQIAQKQNIIQSIQWVLISYDQRDSLIKFSTTFFLNTIPELTLLMDTEFELYERLQIKGIPSCFIYDRRHRLVKIIHGIERIENIVRLANR